MSTEDGRASPPPNRVLFAIGTAEYIEPAYTESAERKSEPNSLSQLIPQSLSVVVDTLTRGRVKTIFTPLGYLLNPKTSKLRKVLAQAGSAGEIVIIYYTGHGEDIEKDGYYLITSDFTSAKVLDKGIRAVDLPQRLLKRHPDGEVAKDNEQPPTLLILDCCFSGAAGLKILRDTVFDGTHPNLWVWATASRTQVAVSGVFAKALSEALRHPTVGVSTEYLPLETVVAAVDDALGATEQSALLFMPPTPRFPRFFPNIEFVPHVAGLTVDAQHWASKAYGGSDSAATGFYLSGRTGRAKASLELAEWITHSNQGRLIIVTGSPGVGKSTLLATVALLTDPDDRTRLLAGTAEDSLAHKVAAILPVDTRVATVHARGLNPDQIAGEIARALGRASSSTMGALLESLEAQPLQTAPVVIIDAVDEANAPSTLRDSLLLPLTGRHGLRLVFGARRHVLPGSEAAQTVIDLDREEFQDPDALVEYVHQLLVAAHEPGISTPYRDADGQVHIGAEKAARAIAERSTSRSVANTAVVESFLVARIIALAVRARSERLDITADTRALQLPETLAEAFEEDLDRLGGRSSAARILLEALALARGTGLPWENIWVPVARALASEVRGDPITGAQLTDDDVRSLLDRSGAYVVEDLGPWGRSVFRLFHDLLAEHLRDKLSGTSKRASDELQAAVTKGLLYGVPQRQGQRDWARVHPYLRTYLAEHAESAGAEVFSALLSEGGFLAAADPATLNPLLVRAPRNQVDLVRAYRRARPVLGDDPEVNAAYLQEAFVGVTGHTLSFAGTGLTPVYRTLWSAVREDRSLLTLGGSSVRAMAFGSGPGEQRLLAVGGRDGMVRIWDLATGAAVSELIGHGGIVEAVAFGSGPGEQRFLAAGDSDGMVRIWDLATGAAVSELIGHGGIVEAVAFGSGPGEQRFLAVGDSDGTVRIWDLVTDTTIFELSIGHYDRVLALHFGSGEEEQTSLAAVAVSGTVRVWDLATGAIVNELSIGLGVTAPASGMGMTTAAAFGSGAGGETLLASAGFGRTVRVWDLATELSSEPVDPAESVVVMAIGFGDWGFPLLATGDISGTVRVWDLGTDVAPGEWVDPAGEVDTLAFGFGAEGQMLLASGDRNGMVRVWDPESGAMVAGPIRSSEIFMHALGFGVSGRILLSSVSGNLHENIVRVWDVATGTAIGNPIRHGGGRLAVAFGSGSEGQPLLASVSVNDATVRVRNVATGTTVGDLLIGNAGEVTTLAFGSGAARQTLLASGHADGTLRVSDLATGVIGEPIVHDAPWVQAVTFGSGVGGQPLLVSARGSTVQFWDADTGVCVMTVRRRKNVGALANQGSRFAIGDDDGLSVVELS